MGIATHIELVDEFGRRSQSISHTHGRTGSNDQVTGRLSWPQKQSSPTMGCSVV